MPGQQQAMGRGATVAGFLAVILIWGSTWLVIHDQIAAVPAEWTVTYRFVLGALGMAALTAARRESLWIGAEGMRVAAVVGVAQFSANYLFVYHAEGHIASGLVAVIYALLMVPNAVLARLVLGARLRGRFLAGSGVAMAGIAMLMAKEYQGGAGLNALIGVGLALGGLISASLANVVQATQAGRRQAVVPLLMWAMVVGAVVDGAVAWGVAGAPVLHAPPRFWAGVAYLALAGSVATFPIYFALIRSMGAGRAAFSQVAVPVVAMALSTVFEGYHWTGLAVAGCVLALAGLVIALTGRSQA